MVVQALTFTASAGGGVAGTSSIFSWIVAIGGPTGIGVVITAWVTRKKINAEAGKSGADAAQVLSAASVALLEPMRAQMLTLSEQLRASNANASEVEGKLQIALGQADRFASQVRELRVELDNLQGQLYEYKVRFGALSNDDRVRDNYLRDTRLSEGRAVDDRDLRGERFSTDSRLRDSRLAEDDELDRSTGDEERIRNVRAKDDRKTRKDRADKDRGVREKRNESDNQTARDDQIQFDDRVARETEAREMRGEN